MSKMKKYNVQPTKNGVWSASYKASDEMDAAKKAFTANPSLNSVWVDGKGKSAVLIHKTQIRGQL